MYVLFLFLFFSGWLGFNQTIFVLPDQKEEIEPLDTMSDQSCSNGVKNKSSLFSMVKKWAFVHLLPGGMNMCRLI